jgi:hypothetical protein
MDWKRKIDGARHLGERVLESFDRDARASLEEHWPKVQQVFQEKIGPAALAAAQDDQKMRQALRLVYDALPFPLRPMVKQEAFVTFCLANRYRLLPEADSARA